MKKNPKVQNVEHYMLDFWIWFYLMLAIKRWFHSMQAYAPAQ